ncbi:Uncharacterized protein Adt_33487 [Abeliophyllum distichum]|uniref:DUF4218 domain-containing protein n=1 Tax=Abeliophyllum distichum TaxID=126358 RepID=A0ABD1QYY8_9LAMI
MSNYKVWHLHREKFETTPTFETTIDTIDGEYGECGDGGDRDYIIDMLPYKFKRLVVDEDTKDNLDVMHIKKNFCDNVVGTILDVDEKSKDDLTAILDLQRMGVRPELHPDWQKDKKNYYIPPACYSMNKTEKKPFCVVLKSIKVPDGYFSNFCKVYKSQRRYLCTLKKYVCNRACPEESIAEGYVIEECLTFVTIYLEDVET